MSAEVAVMPELEKPRIDGGWKVVNVASPAREMPRPLTATTR